MPCFTCGHFMQGDDAFCEGCGAQVAPAHYVTCAHCGQMSRGQVEFCGYCGRNEAGEVKVAANVATVPPIVPAPRVAAAVPPANAPTPRTAAVIPPIATPTPRTAAVIPPIATPTPRVAATIPPIATPTPRPQPTAVPPTPQMPLLIMIDTSAACAPCINHLLFGLSKFIIETSTDPAISHALDMCIIAFDEAPQAIGDLTELASRDFTQPTATRANYAPAIMEATRLAEEYAQTTQAYKPWIVLFSPSPPGDGISAIARHVQSKQAADKLRLIAVGALEFDEAALKTLTDVVLKIDGADFVDFFEWLGGCMGAIVRSRLGEKPGLPLLGGNVYRVK